MNNTKSTKEKLHYLFKILCLCNFNVHIDDYNYDKLIIKIKVYTLNY